MIQRDVLDTTDNIEVEAEEDRPKVKHEFSRVFCDLFSSFKEFEYSRNMLSFYLVKKSLNFRALS